MIEPSLGITLKTLLGSTWSRIHRLPSGANWRSFGSLMPGVLNTFSTRLGTIVSFSRSSLVAAASRDANAKFPVAVRKLRRDNSLSSCIKSSLSRHCVHCNWSPRKEALAWATTAAASAKSPPGCGSQRKPSLDERAAHHIRGCHPEIGLVLHMTILLFTDLHRGGVWDTTLLLPDHQSVYTR